jgi:hypothetical protein
MDANKFSLLMDCVARPMRRGLYFKQQPIKIFYTYQVTGAENFPLNSATENIFPASTAKIKFNLVVSIWRFGARK